MNMASMMWMIIVLPNLTIASGHLAENDAYSFLAEVIDRKANFIQFVFKNKSMETQCIRHRDLDLDLSADSLYVLNKSDHKNIKYVGQNIKPLELAPTVINILLPGESVAFSIYLDKFYDIKHKNVEVSYSIPIFWCKKIMDKHILVPFPQFIKNNIDVPYPNSERFFLSSYPEWVNGGGFIANSGSTEIVR